MSTSVSPLPAFLNPAEHLRDILIEPAPELFYSRHDYEDTRMGDLVIRKMEGYVPEVRVGILGCPQDEGVRRNKGRIGAHAAPTEIRRALYKLTPFSLDADISTLRIFDFGDVRQGLTLEETHDNLAYCVETILSCGITPIVLGGGHDVAYADFLGLSQAVDSVGVVNIDAHLDYRKPLPERHSGSPFRQMLDDESNKLQAGNLVEFGIQPFANSLMHYAELVQRGVTIMTLEHIAQHGAQALFAEALTIAARATERIMVSVDMDAVRSGDAPGVSAPSPLGFHAEEVCHLALAAGQHSKVSLLDVVEVNPMYDRDGQTAKLAAVVIMHFLLGLVRRGL